MINEIKGLSVKLVTQEQLYRGRVIWDGWLQQAVVESQATYNLGAIAYLIHALVQHAARLSGSRGATYDFVEAVMDDAIDEVYPTQRKAPPQ